MKQISAILTCTFQTVGAAIALTVCLLFAPGGIAALHASAAETAWGIDVAKYQGYIDWELVAESGASFAMVRVGSSAGGLDEYFDINMRGASAAGLRVGVYYYCSATTVDEAASEAVQVLGWIEPYTVSFPVAIDIEAPGQKSLSPQTLADIANTFCGIMEGWGYYPMVYSSRNWFRDRIGQVYYDKWIAMYNDRLEYDEPFIMWQSTSHAYVAGIDGRVDLDHLYRDLFALMPEEGFRNEGDRTYYYSGFRRRRGWIDLEQGRYYAAGDLAIQTGWFTDLTGTYYLQPDMGGLAATGFADIDGETYFFDELGVMRTGFIEAFGNTYFCDAAGLLVRGFMETDHGVYFFDPDDGHMVTGWALFQDGRRYFDPESGLMMADITMVSGDETFYFDVNGLAVSAETADPAVP